jgi:hypothetical protein
MQTWRARKERQGRDNGIGGYNSVVRDFSTVFDDGEFALATKHMNKKIGMGEVKVDNGHVR